MAILRVLDKNIFNDELLKGYDAIAFSFNKRFANYIYENNILSNIIPKHIFDVKFSKLIPGQVIVSYYKKETRAICNLHNSVSDIFDKIINYMKVIDICKKNDFKKLLLIIESSNNSAFIKIIDYLSKQYNIDIDLILLFNKNG